MTPKERIIATVSHKEPDKVPAHINATKWVVRKLKNKLGLTTNKELLKALHIDVYDMRGIDLNSGTAPLYTGAESEFFPSTWAGGIASFWRLKEFENFTQAGWNMEMEAPPLAGALTIGECEKYLWPQNDWFDYSDLKERLSEWREFSIMASGGSVFQHATYVRGMDTLMMDMMMDPEMANYILDKFTDFYFEYYRRMFEAAGDMIDVFALADDLGMQNTLLIGPDLFEEYVAPRLKKMAALAHRYNIRLLLHTCGNVEVLIPRLIELGVDILDPIQPESMDPLAIKQKFGRQITLRGGISVQKILTYGTPGQVREETRRIVDALKPGGGYIFSPGHPVLQDEIPAENILVMYDEGYKTGFYNEKIDD